MFITSIHRCATYFMGAYLFNPEPPFAITHISNEPLVPHRFYDETLDGWAFRSIDYIVFPMNIIAVDDLLFLSVGRNDRSGFLVKLNITGLVDSLLPVTSDIILDRFYEHVSYSTRR